MVSLTGKLRKEHIGKGTSTSSGARKEAQSVHETFDAGHFRGRLLGGKGGKKGTFPQWSRINRGMFNKFEQRLAEVVKHSSDNDNFVFSVQPRYRNNRSRQPFQVVYIVKKNGRTIARALFTNEPGRKYIHFLDY